MSRAGRVGAILLGLLASLALLAPLIAGNRPLLHVHGWELRPPVAQDPLVIDLDARLLPPERSHWLGTDELGRDVLSRVVHGARPSLLVAALATAISLLLGVPIGAAAGYSGRSADLILSRLIEAALSFPALVLLLLLTAIALDGTPGGDSGTRSVLVVGGAVGLARWGAIARYTRGEVLRLSSTDLADAARAAGAGGTRVLFFHLLPAGFAPVAISAAFGAGTAVVAEASLSFLGLGVQPPAPTWGQMIAASASGGRAWWMLVFPGLMVALTVAAFNLIGEGLTRRRSG